MRLLCELKQLGGGSTVKYFVTDHLTDSSPSQGMCKTPATIQSTVSGQPGSQAFKNTHPSQSESRALSKVAKRTCWNAYIKPLMAQMGSKCIQERIRAIDQLVDSCTLRPDLVMSCAFSVIQLSRIPNMGFIVHVTMGSSIWGAKTVTD